MNTKVRIPYRQTDNHEDLVGLHLPRALGPRHHPLHHIDAYRSIMCEITNRGFTVVSQKFWLQHAPFLQRPIDKCLMIINLEQSEADREQGLVKMVVIRNSNDQTHALSVTCGHNVFYCTNEIISGDFVPLKKKHTKNVDLDTAVTEGFRTILEHWNTQEKFIKKMKACQPMQEYDVPSMLYDVQQRMEQKVLPDSKFSELVDLTINPPHEEFGSCSVWSAHNAFTELLKDESSPNKPLRSRYLNAAFDSHIDTFPSYLDYQYEQQVPSFVKTLRDYS
tara:strand:- start:2063 stop:2896 length:834 start_codon:yes stop_codon:yes gene_type:complete